jgi:hypothetical protein
MTLMRYAVLFTLALNVILASAAFAQDAANPDAELLRYAAGQPRTALLAIEAELRAAAPDQLPALENRLLRILQSAEATRDAKDWACRQLRHAGSEKSVAALAALLADPQLETVARWALQSIPGAQVDEVLREALTTVPAASKAGVLQTIGSRRDRRAVSAIAPWARDPNAAVAEAALYALGQIGGSEALAAVRTSEVPPAVQRYRFHAMLLCAEQMEAEGQTAAAAKVFREVFAETSDTVIQTAALRNSLLAERAQAADLAEAALKDSSPRLRLAAAKLVCETGDGALLDAVLRSLSALPADSVATVLNLVDDPAARPAVLAAANGDDPAIRLAALHALARIGDASSVSMLLELASASGGAEQAAARHSLQRLRGVEVDTALAAAAERSEPAQRAEAIRTLAARYAVSAVPLLLRTAQDASDAVRIESLGALGALADRQSLSALVRLLVAAPSADQLAAAERALLAACQRISEPDATTAELSAALPGPSAEVRSSLLRVLARIPSDGSLEALRAARRDADAVVQDAAIRGLAEWPDARAIGDMPEIARTAASLPHKVLALRGLVRMAALRGGRAPAETAALLGEALTLAPRSEEKKLALAALGDVPHIAALELAAAGLDDKELEVEAAMAVVKIAKRIQSSDPERAKAAVQKILEVCTAAAARQLAESAWFIIGSLVNIAPQGKASSPDGWEKDGASSGEQAAIDGDPATYWDKEDGKALYRLVVTLPQLERIAALSIVGYEHHRFAPKDFEILGDGKTVKKIEGAQYEDNLLIVKLDEVTCTTVELKITGYYGGSPAIRELGLYRPQ